MNNEPQANPYSMATVITVANEDIENGNDVRRSEAKHNKKHHRTNDESKQNGQSTTLNWYVKTSVIQDTELVTAATNEIVKKVLKIKALGNDSN